MNIKLKNLSAIALFWMFSCYASAQLTIEITQGVKNPTKIAVVPFESTLPPEISQIVAADLERSGLFNTLTRNELLAPYPFKEKDIFFRDFRAVDAEYVLIGSGVTSPGGLMVKYSLYDVLSQKKLLSQQVAGTDGQVRDMAHKIADKVFEKITGIRGAFSTKVIFVQDVKTPARSRYRLMLSDADGARERMLFQSSEPLLSPAWSNDGRKVAYVSFETDRPAIYVQDIKTGRREQVTNFKGLNGAPSFSPDDSKLAIVLSKDGNPELYVLTLANKRLERVTRTSDAIIDTEPNWTKDGKSLIFTSNRGGNPHVYKVSLETGRTERLTFNGNYNARPRLSPDGDTMVMVNRRDDQFRIAWQSLKSGDFRVLTQTELDESPSIAPNGAMLIYATKSGDRGVLAVVSMDAGIKYMLPASSGDVREPVWSPYFEN